MSENRAKLQPHSLIYTAGGVSSNNQDYSFQIFTLIVQYFYSISHMFEYFDKFLYLSILL